MNLQAVNPVARVIALLVFTTPLLVSIDLVSALVSLACTIIGAPILGVSYRVLFRRGLPIVLIAPVSGISMALYGRPEGREYFSVAFAHVTDNSLGLAAAIMVRVLAVGLPVIVLLGTIDPTELGDVRGLDGHNRVRRALTMTFGLLVLALRRGTKLATAMEARGFGKDVSRTWARESRWGWAETLLVVACAVAGAMSIIIAVWCGSFRFLGA